MDLIKEYKKQKHNAEGRKIKWLFTYETWFAWWDSTGKLEKRGRGSSNYCMCRIADEGPYSPENVYCATNAENIKDAFNNGKCKNTGWIMMDANKRSEIGRLGGKSSAETTRNKGLELSKEHLVLIKDIDMTKYGWVSKASKILNVSHTQVKRLIDKYYVGDIYRRK